MIKPGWFVSNYFMGEYARIIGEMFEKGKHGDVMHYAWGQGEC